MSKAPSFSYTPGQVKTLSESVIKELEEKLRVLVDIPGPRRDFRNTMLAFENAVSGFGEAVQLPIMLAYVSDNEELRKAGQELELKISQYSVDLFTREDVFGALNEYAAKGEKLGEVDARLLEKTLLDFKRNGLGLEPRKKNKIKKLMKELIGIELQFSKNLREVNDTLELTGEELKGMPEDYRSRLKKTEGGKYLLTMNYPDVMPFMDSADNGEARRKLEFVFNNRCSGTNIKLMEDAIALRRKIAKLLGYATYADYVLADRMAANSGNVFAFLERTWAKLKKKGRKELRARMKLKGGEEKAMHSWEWRYYNNLLKKTKYSIDHEKIKEYFPLETVLKGMFEVVSELFGVKFIPTPMSVWHKDVRSYEVRENDDSLAGYFYLDLFPRESKYKHVICCTLRSERESINGPSELPVSAILANFSVPAGNIPALLNFNEVYTLFHEFGHVLQMIFSRAKYSRLASVNAAWDFVEVPSTTLQQWAYEPSVMRRVSGHYKDGTRKLPEETIKNLIAARYMDSGMHYLRLIAMSMIDMRYHTARGRVDVTRIYEKLMKKISLVSVVEGSHPEANFAHIMGGGYAAGYYSYVWAEVVAADIFEIFKSSGIMNRDTGRKYRDLILAPGASLDEAGQIETFLSRSFSEKAFLENIGAA